MIKKKRNYHAGNYASFYGALEGREPCRPPPTCHYAFYTDFKKSVKIRKSSFVEISYSFYLECIKSIVAGGRRGAGLPSWWGNNDALDSV